MHKCNINILCRNAPDVALTFKLERALHYISVSVCNEVKYLAMIIGVANGN